MNLNLNEILLNRKNSILVTKETNQENIFDKYLLAATASKNLESLGFRYSKNLIEQLKESSKEEILEIEKQIFENLEARLGADVEYHPMYPGFPESVMLKKDFNLYLDAMIYAESGFKELPNDKRKNEDKEKIKSESELMKALKIIDYGKRRDIGIIMSNLMASPVALSQNDKNDLITAAKEMKEFKSFVPEKIPNKENLTWLAGTYMQEITYGKNPFIPKMHSATDVLRLIVLRNGGDTSLTQNVKFRKKSEKEARLYAIQIAKTKNTEKEISERPEMFKRVFKTYHLPTFYKGKSATDYLKKEELEKMNQISDKLYNRDLESTFESKRRLLAKERNYLDLVNLYKLEPGKMAKDMNWLIVTAHNLAQNELKTSYEEIMNQNISDLCFVFKQIVHRIDTNNLLKMQAMLNLRTQKKDFNVYSPNKGLGNPYMTRDTREPIKKEIVDRINDIVDSYLKSKYQAKRPLGKVYLDKELKGIKIPSAQRTDSKNSQTLPYGSQIKLEPNTKIIRGFIWWTNGEGHHRRVDIDLSAGFYDANWNKLADVSYMALKGSGYGVHSGDIRDGGNPGGCGAAEFIDFSLERIKEKGARYVVFAVNNFSEINFEETPCKFGWMTSEDPMERLFDKDLVQTAIELNTKSTRSIPVAFDVAEEKLIWMDRNPKNYGSIIISDKNGKTAGNNVRTHATSIEVETYKAMNLPAPSLYHLMELHIAARGERVENIEDATTVFSLERINDIVQYPNMKESICSYDKDAILGDLLPIELSTQDIEYFKELERLEKEMTEIKELEDVDKTEEFEKAPSLATSFDDSFECR